MKKRLFVMDYLKFLKIIGVFMAVYALCAVLVAVLSHIMAVAAIVVGALSLIVMGGTSLAFILYIYVYYNRTMYGELGRFVNSIPLKTSEVVLTKWSAIFAGHLTLEVGQALVFLGALVGIVGIKQTGSALYLILDALTSEFPFRMIEYGATIFAFMVPFVMIMSSAFIASSVVGVITLANVPRLQKYPLGAPVCIFLLGYLVYLILSVMSIFFPLSLYAPIVPGSDPIIATGPVVLGFEGYFTLIATATDAGPTIAMFPLGSFLLQPILVAVILAGSLAVVTKRLRVR